MTENSYVLAIDLGTSGPKVALVARNGRVAASEIEETRLLLLADGGAEQDPADWWNGISRASKRLMAAKPRAKIEAVAVTAQWSGTVPVDQTGYPLMNAIIWMDSRGAKQAKKLNDGLIKAEGYSLFKLWKFLRITGGAPAHSGKDSLAHILFLKEEHPEIYARTYKFLEPKDYLNLKLTGKFAASFDSIALHWVTDNRKINSIDYHPSLLTLTGIPREKLPDLGHATDILGKVKASAATDLGIPEGIPVIYGTPDLQSGAVGSGAVKDFEGHLYIGTSSWLTCHVPFKKTDILHNMATLPSGIPGRYFIANEQETAGYCLTYLRDKVFYPDDELGTGPAPKDAYARMTKLASTVPPGSDGLLFAPWMYGERTPIEDSTVRGAFFNQSLSTTRGHMVRAVLEGVAFNSKWLLGYVESFIGRRFDSINMIGGGARSDLWCQIIADVLDRPVKQVEDPVQANTRGIGLLGWAAVGKHTFEEISANIPITDTFQPNPANRSVYDALFKEFLIFYKQNKKSYARLNTK